MSDQTFVDKCINFLDALYHRKQKLDLGGGEDAIAKQHARGKLTARERILVLLDTNSFEEIDKFVKNRGGNFGLDKKQIPYDGVITGFGTIEGEKVAVFSQDFTVQAGSLGEMHAKKIMKLQDMAMKYGVPVIGINDSGGARIQEGVDALFGYGGIFLRNTHASGVIPQISIIAGPCAGGAVYSPAITDFTIMVEQTSQMFITGPAVVKAVTHENIDKEALGGAKVHNAVSGCAHFIAKDDEDALKIAQKILSYVPRSNMYKPKEEKFDTNQKVSKEIYTTVPENPKKGFDVRDVIKHIFDKNSFFEVQEHFAKNMVIGFARVAGKSVGIIANQPNFLAGVIDINASDKASRFIRFCDAFNIPIITFVDTPGFLPGVGQEHGGVIRHGAKLLYSYSEASVPLVSIILRKSYGGAYIAMASQHLGADFVFAWPSAEIAVMGAEGAANIIFAREINNSENPEETRLNKISEYKEKFSNPYVAAERGYIEDVFDWLKVVSPGEYNHPYYSLRRVWRLYEKISPNSKFKSVAKNGYTKEYPFSIKPEKKLSLNDLFALTRDWYQNTKYDLSKGIAAGPFGNISRYGGSNKIKGNWERAISLYRTSYVYITQSRANLPDPIGGVVWWGCDAPHSTCFVPFYCGMTDLPRAYQIGDQRHLNRKSAWWAFNYVSNIINLKFNYMIKDIQQEQAKIENREINQQNIIDNKALELYRQNIISCKEYLTKTCTDNADKVYKDWWKLSDELIVKYQDGYVYQNDEFKTPEYNEKWLKEVNYKPLKYEKAARKKLIDIGKDNINKLNKQ